MKLYVLCVILLCSPTAFARLPTLFLRYNDAVHAYEQDCTIESGADASLVSSAVYAQKIPDDARLDAFAICMLKKYNILYKDGSLNRDFRSYTVFSDSLDKYRIFERCKDETGKDAGETARKIMNCFADAEATLMPFTPDRHAPPPGKKFVYTCVTADNVPRLSIVRNE